MTSFAILANHFTPPDVSEFEYPCIGPKLKIFGINACVNRVVILVAIVAFLLIILFVLAFRKPKMVPTGLQNLFEAGIDFIRYQIIFPVLGNDGQRFLPYLTTLFFFVFFTNVFGVLPGINFPVSSRMAIPLFLALLSWGLFVGVGIRAQGFGGYLKSTLFPTGVPWPMYFLVTPIEFVSVFLVRPVTLSVRLLANMMAGHLLLTIFFLGTAYLLQPNIQAVFAVASFGLSLALVGFELVVAVLQAYIFTILTAVYVSGALAPEH